MSLKSSLRSELKKNLSNLDVNLKRRQSEAVCKLFLNTEFYRKAGSIACYCSESRSEVETISLIKTMIEDGKKVCLPVVESEDSDLQFYSVKDPDKDLVRGLWGIYQPDNTKCERTENTAVNTVIVPALGFSENGDRLGRGRGFYDRWLSKLDESVLKIGFSFREQILSDIFSEPHDVRMDAVITPDSIIMINSAIKNQESLDE